jgi:hypothetical protein
LDPTWSGLHLNDKVDFAEHVLNSGPGPSVRTLRYSPLIRSFATRVAQLHYSTASPVPWGRAVEDEFAPTPGWRTAPHRRSRFKCRRSIWPRSVTSHSDALTSANFAPTGNRGLQPDHTFPQNRIRDTNQSQVPWLPAHGPPRTGTAV